MKITKYTNFLGFGFAVGLAVLGFRGELSSISVGTGWLCAALGFVYFISK